MSVRADPEKQQKQFVVRGAKRVYKAGIRRIGLRGVSTKCPPGLLEVGEPRVGEKQEKHTRS